jgi:hypothetical protein
MSLKLALNFDEETYSKEEIFVRIPRLEWLAGILHNQTPTAHTQQETRSNEICQSRCGNVGSIHFVNSIDIEEVQIKVTSKSGHALKLSLYHEEVENETLEASTAPGALGPIRTRFLLLEETYREMEARSNCDTEYLVNMVGSFQWYVEDTHARRVDSESAVGNDRWGHGMTTKE